MSFQSPNPEPLPKQRTQECYPIQVIGVDYEDPIYYRPKNKAISKSYLLLLSCSVSRAINLELVPNLTTQEFIKSMKRLIARRGVLRYFILTMQRHSRLKLCGLPEFIKMRSFTIF